MCGIGLQIITVINLVIIPNVGTNVQSFIKITKIDKENGGVIHDHVKIKRTFEHSKTIFLKIQPKKWYLFTCLLS